MTKTHAGAITLLGAAGVALTLLLQPVSPLAYAETSATWTDDEDSAFVALCDSVGIHHGDGSAAEAEVGRAIADDLARGISPAAESSYVYSHTNNTITHTDADLMVKAAGMAYLGSGRTHST
jgi:Protein of unknown function (DUF732)